MLVARRLLDLNSYVFLSVDVMLGWGIGFFDTEFIRIHFLTQEYVPKRTSNILAKDLNNVMHFYNTHNSNITTCI